MTLSRATRLPVILGDAAISSRVLLPFCRRRGRTQCSFGLAIGTGTWVVFLRHLPQFRGALVFLLRRPPPVVSSCSGLMRALRLFRWPTATLALDIGALGGSYGTFQAELQTGTGMSWIFSCAPRGQCSVSSLANNCLFQRSFCQVLSPLHGSGQADGARASALTYKGQQGPQKASASECDAGPHCRGNHHERSVS